jgi:hypothetical protein
MDFGSMLSIGGAILGGIGGSKSSTKTAENAPWAPAQPYLKDNLELNDLLQTYYLQNPFSDLQKQQYQGFFNTLHNNQANGAGLLGVANNFMNSRGGKMGDGMRGPQMQSGLLAPTINWDAMNPANSPDIAKFLKDKADAKKAGG